MNSTHHDIPFLRPDGTVHLVVPQRPGADLQQLRSRLEDVAALQAHDVVWHIPDQRGDIVTLAQDAAQAAHADGGLLVAAGGDGTINAVSAAALRSGVPLGVIPMGTFNYFSREHGLALDPQTAVEDMLQALRNGDMRPVQVGFVNRRMFVVNASVGLYPKLLAEREKASRRYGRSRGVAVASAVWTLLRPAAGRRWRVLLRTHQGAQVQQEEHLVSTLFVGNNPLQLDRLGLPQAQTVAEGGKLAVVLVQPQGRWAMARTVWNAATGQLDRDEAVVGMACSELTVEPANWRPARVKVAFDGERESMAPPLQFRLGDRPLWLVAPTPLERDRTPDAAREAKLPDPPEPAGGLVPA